MTIHELPTGDTDHHIDSMMCRCVPHVDLYEDPRTHQFKWIIRHSRMGRRAA